MSNAIALAPGRPAVHDPEDYADEWLFLTAMGVRSDEIIRRSIPTARWFTEHVRPLVDRSRCTHCDAPFDPQESGSLTFCSEICRRARRQAAWS